MKKSIEQTKYVSNIFFNDLHGICVKFMSNGDANRIYGYFTRAEIGTDESGNKIVVVDFTYSPILQLKTQLDGRIRYEYANPCTIKTIAMERILNRRKDNKLKYCKTMDVAYSYILERFYLEDEYVNRYANYLSLNADLLDRANLLNEKCNVMTKRNDIKVNSLVAAVDNRNSGFDEYLYALLKNVYKYYKDSQVKLFVIA